MISQGRERKNGDNSQENFREREFLSCSAIEYSISFWTLPSAKVLYLSIFLHCREICLDIVNKQMGEKLKKRCSSSLNLTSLQNVPEWKKTPR